jgi:hypothetical protein
VLPLAENLVERMHRGVVDHSSSTRRDRSLLGSFWPCGCPARIAGSTYEMRWSLAFGSRLNWNFPAQVVADMANKQKETHKPPVPLMPDNPPRMTDPVPSPTEISQQPIYSTTPPDVAAAMASIAAGTVHEKNNAGVTAEEGGGAGKRESMFAFIGLGLILVGVAAIIIVAAII